MKRPQRARAKAQSNGFTIVEVMIALVIGSVMLLIVFLAVPALQRNQRNSRRRAAVAYIAAQMEQWYQSHHNQFPYNAKTVGHEGDPNLDMRPAFIASLSGSVVDGYSVHYWNASGSHEYPYTQGNHSITFVPSKLDEISIEPSHKCNLGGKPGDTDFPLAATATGDNNFHAYVVWTQLEGDGVISCDSNQ